MMKLVAGLAVVLGATTALAAEASPDVHSGETIVSADGKRIGQIDEISTDRSGARWAVVIMEEKIVHVPVASLSAGQNGRLVTSLNKADVRKLN